MNNEFEKILLQAKDGQDLAVIAGLIQDSILQISDTQFDKEKNTFACVLNRFAWEINDHDKPPYIRTHSILHFSGVKKVSSMDIDMEQDRMYSLLSAIPTKGEDGGVNIFLSFAGGGAIRVSADEIKISLKDVGDYWETENKPAHENNEIDD